MDIKTPIDIIIEKLSSYRLFKLQLIAAFILYQKTVRQFEGNTADLLDVYLKLSNSYCNNDSFGIALQIALKVIDELQHLPDSNQKAILNASAHHELGCSYGTMGDWINAAKNHRIALNILKNLNETNELYCNCLISFAYSTYKINWIPNKAIRAFTKLTANVMNSFKGMLIKKHIAYELKNNRKYFLNIILREMPEEDIEDEDKLIKKYIHLLKDDITKEINISNTVNSYILTVSEGKALCKKIIDITSDRAIAIGANEILAHLHAYKDNESALFHIEQIISETKNISSYKKHPYFIFAYSMKGALLKDDSLEDISKDILLTRYENDNSLINLINCCLSFANTLFERKRIDDAIYLFKECENLYSKLDEVNYYNLKELFKNLSICYEHKACSDKAEFYKNKAEKYTPMVISINTRQQINSIGDISTFLYSETMRIFYEFRNTLHDLTDEESLQHFESYFIDYVEKIICSLENSKSEFRDFETCHKTLVSILNGEQKVLESMMDNMHSETLYNNALAYRNKLNSSKEDMEKSFELLNRACEMGNVDATTEIGLFYYTNPVSSALLDNVPNYNIVEEVQNIPLAKFYWKEAAFKGDARAMYYMGQHYYNTDDYNNAKYWLNLASDRGFLYADYLLGALHSNNEYKRFFDYDEAISRYTKVANSTEEHYQDIAESAKSALESLRQQFG